MCPSLAPPVVVLESEAQYVNEANLGVISPLSIDESSGTVDTNTVIPSAMFHFKENDESEDSIVYSSSSTLFVAGRGGGGGEFL